MSAVRSAVLSRQRRRREATVIKDVRDVVMLRDGYCRVFHLNYRDIGGGVVGFFSICSGPSEWAHWGQHRRHNTRRMAADARHTSAGTLALCRFHHAMYDAHEWEIEALTDRGADGPLRFQVGDEVFDETR